MTAKGVLVSAMVVPVSAVWGFCNERSSNGVLLSDICRGSCVGHIGSLYGLSLYRVSIPTSYLSNTIFEEFITLIDENVLQKLVKEVKNSK